MKKRTITIILLAFNVCLLISIVVLVLRINARGPKPEEVVQEEETVMTTTITDQLAEETAAAPVERTSESFLMVIPAATTSVNVRSGPGTDYQRVGSAYADCEYRVLELTNSEWTKIDYDGINGYLYNEFIKFQIRTDYSDGTSSYSEVDEDTSLEEYVNTTGSLNDENASDDSYEYIPEENDTEDDTIEE